MEIFIVLIALMFLLYSIAKFSCAWDCFLYNKKTIQGDELDQLIKGIAILTASFMLLRHLYITEKLASVLADFAIICFSCSFVPVLFFALISLRMYIRGEFKNEPY
ncbi:hypothetical protein C0583_06370 [Candidatus Parcubacteria bacterium]|nr:MAG: hypothetical protein C0583_06370 [Candidatus Parcubacteria bacterium]